MPDRQLVDLPVNTNQEIINNIEYLVFDCDFNLLQISALAEKYADCPEQLVLGQDIRLSFPELVGLEATCNAILAGELDNFVLNGITRHLESNNDVIYFDLHIKTLKNNLIVFIEDCTELMSLRQTLVQRVNEAEIVINRLRRFEYCTNKIVASMGDVLFITTATGKIDRINKATLKLFGYSKAELLQQPIDRIIAQDNFSHHQIYNFLIKEKSKKKIEVICHTKNQREVQIEFNCFVVPTEIEGILNCVYIGRDITAHKQAQQEVCNALEKERELRQLKSSFISMASHEFRNPLSSILICTEALANNEELDHQESKFYLQSIRDAALNMQSLLEDILIIGKTELGKQQLKLTQLNLEKLCRQIIQEVKSAYQDRIINLITQGDFTNLYLDEKLLWHILTNLLANALKYSPATETVELKLDYDECQTQIIIEVSDRGIGIPAAAQKHLFESFYRASNVGNVPGSGLGLAIVKKAVDLHQGTIIVVSNLNQGATFTVTLPVNINDSSVATSSK